MNTINDIDLDKYREILSEQKKFVSAIYGDAQKYITVVITIGYAGFFTILSTVKDYLNKDECFTISISIAISLATYIFWEVGKMIFMSVFQLNYFKSVTEDPTKYFEKQAKFAQKSFELNKKMIPWWITVLVISIPSGVTALFLLFKSLLFN